MCQSNCDRSWSSWGRISYHEKADCNLNWNPFCLNYSTRSLTRASNFGCNLVDAMFRKDKFVQEGNRSRHCAPTFNNKIWFSSCHIIRTILLQQITYIFCAFGNVMGFYRKAPKYPLICNYTKTFGSWIYEVFCTQLYNTTVLSIPAFNTFCDCRIYNVNVTFVEVNMSI